MTCPSCGRPAIGLATEHCIYCLRAMPGAAGDVAASQILRLTEFDRSRSAFRKKANRNPWGRRLLAVLMGLVLAAAALSVFGWCLRWVSGVFAPTST